MSDFPETIWAFPDIGECVDAEEVTDELRSLGITKYRRDDLPATLSAAMELPEVRALLASLDDIQKRMDLDQFAAGVFANDLRASVATFRAALRKIQEPEA